LTGFDGGVFSSGSHCVLGTLVIRTSNELTASKQKALEQAIIDVLEGRTPKALAEPSTSPASTSDGNNSNTEPVSTVPSSENANFKTETYARLKFLIDSSWEKELRDDGRCLYYPSISEPTGVIQCTWVEAKIGVVSDDQARSKLDAGILGAQEKFKNVEEISRAYYKIGDKNAMRVVYYHDLEDNDINSDKRGIIDSVVVLFDDGVSMFLAIFTETEYDVTYSNIIKTAIESIELDTTATSSDKPTTTPDADSSSTASTDWRQLLKDYEEFMDDYIAILKKYTENPLDTSILGDYMDMMTELEERSDKYDDMSDDLDDPDELAEFMKEWTRIYTKQINAIAGI
jgi:hypothetical protein